jgi:hypothetical protein
MAWYFRYPACIASWEFARKKIFMLLSLAYANSFSGEALSFVLRSRAQSGAIGKALRHSRILGALCDSTVSPVAILGRPWRCFLCLDKYFSNASEQVVRAILQRCIRESIAFIRDFSLWRLLESAIQTLESRWSGVLCLLSRRSDTAGQDRNHRTESDRLPLLVMMLTRQCIPRIAGLDFEYSTTID